MAKILLIDGLNDEETRVALVNENKVEVHDCELSGKKQTRGNIYLGRIAHIEPALHAAFVEYGDRRHGFLSLSDIDKTYFSNNYNAAEKSSLSKGNDETIDGNPNHSAPQKNQRRSMGKSPGLLKRNQLVLVQVLKQERGSKGASLTTHISLSGRYCVLMPTSGGREGGGVSRKIDDAESRKRLKEIVADIDIAEGMALIVRTAGSQYSKEQIQKDYRYLLRLWTLIQEKCRERDSIGLLFEENSIIKRAIRDIYTDDTHSIWVSGDKAFQNAIELMNLMMPDQINKLHRFQDSKKSLFEKFEIDNEFRTLINPSVNLPSGGNIVITTTEAMVTIDVNSCKANQDNSVHHTILKTNLEAAEEIARQIRLRNLGGLLVIDFIDMSNNNDVNLVETIFNEAIKLDRAKMQVGKISQFGILEMTRQRMNPSILEIHTTPCRTCRGRGFVRTPESLAAQIFRELQRLATQKAKTDQGLRVYTSCGLDMYLLNEKRRALVELEKTLGQSIIVEHDPTLKGDDFVVALDVRETVENADLLLSKEELLLLNSLTSFEQKIKTKGEDKFRRKNIMNQGFKPERPTYPERSDYMPTELLPPPVLKSNTINIPTEIENTPLLPIAKKKKRKKKVSPVIGAEAVAPITGSQSVTNFSPAPVIDEGSINKSDSFVEQKNKEKTTELVEISPHKIINPEKPEAMDAITKVTMGGQLRPSDPSNQARLFEHFIYYKGKKKRGFSAKAQTRETHLLPKTERLAEEGPKASHTLDKKERLEKETVGKAIQEKRVGEKNPQKPKPLSPITMVPVVTPLTETAHLVTPSVKNKVSKKIPEKLKQRKSRPKKSQLLESKTDTSPTINDTNLPSSTLSTPVE